MGYLEGDGSWDEKNTRWRLGFTRNYNLEHNLRTICGRLNIRLTLNQSVSKCQTGEFKSFRGEIRFENDNKYMTEIVAISKARCRYVYDIGVEDEPHLYATLSGTLIHNSKPNCRPESVPNRPTCSHETILQLSKSKSYFFDHENVKEPLKHPGAVGMKFGGKKYPKNEQISNTTYSGNTYDAAALSGRRIRNSWYFPTANYRGAHTATFPMILPEKCILASTSDHGSCAKCGVQYTRVVNKTDEVDSEWRKSCGADSKGEYNGKALKDYESQGAENASTCKKNVLKGMRKKETTGWKKQCNCDTNMILPSLVGDPFVGVGTSALAAIKNKRDYFGIDIDEKNVTIANERIEKFNKIGKI
jgi:hypothetical protein